MMTEDLCQQVDETLDIWAQHLEPESTTLQAILREDAWGDIAACAKGEGYHELAEYLIEAENMQWGCDTEE